PPRTKVPATRSIAAGPRRCWTRRSLVCKLSKPRPAKRNCSRASGLFSFAKPRRATTTRCRRNWVWPRTRLPKWCNASACARELLLEEAAQTVAAVADAERELRDLLG